jgi:hypothetical protein
MQRYTFVKIRRPDKASVRETLPFASLETATAHAKSMIRDHSEAVEIWVLGLTVTQNSVSCPAILDQDAEPPSAIS